MCEGLKHRDRNTRRASQEKKNAGLNFVFTPEDFARLRKLYSRHMAEAFLFLIGLYGGTGA